MPDNTNRNAATLTATIRPKAHLKCAVITIVYGLEESICGVHEERHSKLLNPIVKRLKLFGVYSAPIPYYGRKVRSDQA